MSSFFVCVSVCWISRKTIIGSFLRKRRTSRTYTHCSCLDRKTPRIANRQSQPEKARRNWFCTWYRVRMSSCLIGETFPIDWTILKKWESIEFFEKTYFFFFFSSSGWREIAPKIEIQPLNVRSSLDWMLRSFAPSYTSLYPIAYWSFSPTHSMALSLYSTQERPSAS